MPHFQTKNPFSHHSCTKVLTLSHFVSSAAEMCLSTYKIALLVLFCVGFLSIQPEIVSASRNIDLALRSFRILRGVALEEEEMAFKIAPSPAMSFDPNQSEKRKVKGGSDPIHNRS